MHSKEIVEYIESELEKGFHIDDIRRALKAVGHDVQIIEDSILHVHKKKQRKEKIRKLALIIIPLLIVLVILAVMLLPKFLNNANNSQNQNISQPVPIVIPDKTLYEDAISTGNLDLCNQINSSSLKSRCNQILSSLNSNNNITIPPQVTLDRDLYEDAISTGNLDLCNQINSSSLKSRCLSILSSLKAPTPTVEQTTSNSTNTINPNTQQDRSYYENAISTGDKTLCDKIASSSLKSRCLSILK